MSILVVGEALVDIVIRPGHEPAHSPGGSPANVALGLGRLGEEVTLLTDIGYDPLGRMLRTHLAASNVDVRATDTGPTSTAMATITLDGSAHYDVDLRWNPDPALLDVRRWSAIHIGSIAAFLEPGCAIIDVVLDHRGGATLRSFDPNIRPHIIGDHDHALARFESLVARVDLVKLSNVDADWLYPELSMTDQLARILGLGADLVALTKGADGAVLSTTSATVNVGTPTVDVVDTIGAGDSFMSSLLHDLCATDMTLSLLRAEDLKRLGTGATERAAVTVALRGADPPWES